MVGMGVREQHGIDMLDTRGKQLLAQVGRCVDQHGRAAAPAEPFHQQRAAPPPVLRVLRIAIAPDVADAGHAPGGAAAQNGEPHAHAASAARGVLA
jgi:hypothetical protein